MILTEVTEAVSEGIEIWLRAELEESRDGRNRVLDKYDEWRKFLGGTIEDSNVDAVKSYSHFSRYQQLLPGYEATRGTHPYATAKILHHLLMYASGGFRVQNMLESGDQSEYEAKRFAGLFGTGPVTGIYVPEAVEEGLGTDDTLGYLCQASAETNEQILADHNTMNNWFKDYPDKKYEVFSNAHPMVRLALRRQRAAVTMAARHIGFYARALDVDFSEVPFLEPKSITDAKPDPIYPIPRLVL